MLESAMLRREARPPSPVGEGGAGVERCAPVATRLAHGAGADGVQRHVGAQSPREGARVKAVTVPAPVMVGAEQTHIRHVFVDAGLQGGGHAEMVGRFPVRVNRGMVT